MISILKSALYRLKRLFGLYVLQDKKLAAHNKWLKDKGEFRRFDYPLNENSIVFDLGGYKGEFTEEIYNKFNCTVYVFEPVFELFKIIQDKFNKNNKIHAFNFGLSDCNKSVKINLADNSSSIYGKNGIKETIKLVSIFDFISENKIYHVDLLKINIEGGEYEVLPELINKGCVVNIENLQIQFHDFVDNAISKREKIINDLSETHTNTYSYYMIWENWKIKK
jgi:FkbM family methyltransferase